MKIMIVLFADCKHESKHFIIEGFQKHVHHLKTRPPLLRVLGKTHILFIKLLQTRYLFYELNS